MNQSIYVNWGGGNVKLTWLPTDQLPSVDKVTSVHGICFDKDRILLVHVKDRGFSIPGGHVEDNELLEQALHREVHEEGYVKGRISGLLGMIKVNHQENPNFDPNGKYPMIGYQVFYRMEITECLPYARENEATARVWVEASEFPYVINDHALMNLILKEALTIFGMN
ncbi:NUDIX domain-containing protein [Paenibacillus albiflavus]|uniref:NUDIX domain-containing protein n=1 Tax=Paenibacillus albiflavus TaxID=2545760 RepID=A0A4R4EH96_9BACL|nr:NUDIX domain-containing protein [Paenibacillus albiflavus]TCZ79486.1 NUDIX domain-containing protein [Paenibacillus albiflavus]